MSEFKELLEKRTKAKKKKPKFLRKDHFKKPKLSKKWKKPRGLHNKLRLKKKGHSKNPSRGYGSPVKIRGFHNSGLVPVLVSNIGNLEEITKEKGVLLSSRIGDRKRRAIIEETKKRGFVLLNLDADKVVAKIDLKLKERKDKKKKKKEEKKEKKEKKKGIEEKVKKEEKKAEEKKKKAEMKTEEPTEEEKKKIEKKEKDKFLTKKT